MSAYKKLIGITAGIFVAFVCLTYGWDGVLGVASAHAQASGGGFSTALLKNLQYFMSFVLTALNFLMWVFFLVLDIIMRPEFIFSGDLLSRINVVWRLSRDLVNVCFALALVGGAVWGTVTANTEKLKAAMPKFVLGVILVNFSWFIPRVIFDVSQIMTATVYQVPSLVPGGSTCYIPNSDTGQYEPCQQVTQVLFLDQTNSVVPGQDGWSCPLWHLVCAQFKPMNAAAGTTQSGILNGLVVNYGRLRSLIYARNPDVTGLTAGTSISTEVIETVMILFEMVLVLAIHIALFFPILALVLAFFIRIPILWVTMAFMPFVVLGYVFGDKIPEPLNPIKKIQDEFIKAVFLPVFIAVPFAIGFVLLNVASLSTPPAGIPALQTGLPVLAGVTNYWQLVWLLMSLFVLWAGVFGVLKNSSKIIAGVAGKIESYGSSIGKLAAQAPLSVPIVPGLPTISQMWKKNPLSQSNINKQLESIKTTGQLGQGLSQTTYNSANNTYRTSASVINNNPRDSRSVDAVRGMLRTMKTDIKSAGMSDEELLKSFGRTMQLDTAARTKLLEALAHLQSQPAPNPTPAPAPTTNPPQTPPAQNP